MPAAGQEFRRKVRLMTRGLRSVVLRRRLLDPRRSGLYALHLFSHKVLRRLVPVLLPVLFVASVLLASRTFYLAVVCAQSAFYGTALVGFLLRRSAPGRWKLFSLPFYFCLANLAALLALGQLLGGRRVEHWRPQRHASGT